MMIEKVCPAIKELSNAQVDSKGYLSFTLKGFPEWRLTHYTHNLHQLPDEVVFSDDVWFDNELLQFLNERPQGVEQSIVVLEHEAGQRIKLSVQDLIFEPGKQVRQEIEPQKARGWLDIRNRLAKLFSFKVLAFGQFMVSGDHGWQSSEEILEERRPYFAKLIHTAAFALARHIGGYQSVLLKDLCLGQGDMADAFTSLGYYNSPADPSMQLNIVKDWNTMDDYLLDITSKYRVRYRRTRKKLPEKLVVKELNLEDCEQMRTDMYDLYQSVRSEAAFDAVSLGDCYFVSLKRTLGNRFRVFGYFLDEKLLGFYTTIDNGEVMHAHYLGFDQSLNRKYHLYHNMLFDLLEQAIKGGHKRLDYGRTALEIKSSVGAVPREYYCGIQAVNPFANWLIPTFMPAVFQPQQWTQRKPLKVREL